MNHRVQVADTGESFFAQAQEPLLEAAERAGVALAHDCRAGGCGTCRIRLLQGRVAYEDFPMGLTAEEADEGFALACQARACSDLTISAARALPLCSPPSRYRAAVRSVRALGPDVVHLGLAIEAAQALVYRPGQYMNILLPDGSPRSFSMASAPAAQQEVDFHVRRIPGGRFTEGMLAQMRSGDPLEVEVPLGGFAYHAEDYRPLLMVATGTGLAPIKSILESLMDDPDCPPVTLYWGARHAEDLYLHEQIQEWAGRLYDFQYVPVLSRADERWTGRRGYVTEAIAQDFPDLSEHAIYLCGSPRMIVDAKRRFASQNASLAHVYADSFNFQHELAPSL
ncbi:2Fe-2S iron-sulfur cluster-binding protein [Variovorax terrae]|uniref:2Fe-2S iron-sulfur cluster-binding protein n=1 Tax=Variovorax terrae TaxID=2923278 RepID=A0A9X2AN48_9BURK|nr:2Fe-2S iron-sulfur cluster-binding protein [Variovorax terrae]MCJ0764433.1 2Fe-2S iron-sulfur cluster-binding protein [Variovorax terrae]